MRARGAAFPQRWVSAGRNRVSPAAVGLLGLLALGMAACGSSPAAGRSNAIAAVQPLPRSSAAMAYDPSSRAVVLYGGVDVARTASGHRHDTWLWSGSWKQYAGFSPELANPAMAYDGAHRQMILVGLTDPVFDDDEARFAQPVETWVWDGRGWRNPHPQPAPHATLDPPTLAYDTVAQEMILVEREPSIGESMWRWTGTGWAALPPMPDGAPGSPPRHVRMLITGLDGRITTSEGGTQKWDGQAWRAAGPVLPPGGVATVDERHHRLVAYASGLRGLQDSATLIGSAAGSLERVDVSHPPPARSEASIAFDPVTDTVVLFGGHAPTEQGGLADTWVWNGRDWSQAPAT